MQEEKNNYNNSLSIRSYALLIIVSGVLLFGVLTWFAIHQLDSLEATAKSRTVKLADEEIISTLQEINQTAKLVAQNYAEWDETVQQLSLPTYYAYWRNNRAMQANFALPYLESIEIYDSQGKILAKSPHKDMPAQISGADISDKTANYVKNGFLFYQNPVIDDIKNQHISGYVIIKLNLIKALKTLHNFKYVDVNSLSFSSVNYTRIELNDLKAYLHYEPLANDEFERLRDLMVYTLEQFGYLSAAFAMIFIYLLFKVVALPLRKLSFYIDRLKNDNSLTADYLGSESLPVLEFLKIHKSLHNYHKELSESTSALRKSETHKQAILDNVADGIVTINEQGNIKSYNPAAAKIFGYTDTELLNSKFIGLIEEGSKSIYKSLLEEGILNNKCNDETINAFELTAVRKNGNSISIELALSKMQLDDSYIYIGVVRDISERKLAEKKLIYLANYDTLTNLPNRILLKDRIHHAMARATRNERLIGILFLDLDRFKTINDTLGHHAGDLLLKSVANRLTQITRECDTVARLGGDEFTIILESIHHVDEAIAMAEKLCSVFSEPFKIMDQDVFISTSIGITIYPFDDTDTDNLLKNADIAMYQAKETGGDSYAFYEPEMDANATTWLALENKLRNALDNNEFHLCYQPRINIHTRQVVGAEALLRWQQPEHGLISPVDFIPMLEETGMIVAVGKWVLETACKQNAEWQNSGFANLRISVNLSPRQFRNNNLIDDIKSTLEQIKLDPKWLELEITESMLVDNVEMATTTLKMAHDLGVHISIDDFGTGYSSLSYLKRFRINTLKIDQAFVKDITTDPDDAAISSAIVALARSMNLNITAEGVETKKQLNHLKQLGCDEAQGFLFGRPMQSEVFEDWLKKYNDKLETIDNSPFNRNAY